MTIGEKLDNIVSKIDNIESKQDNLCAEIQSVKQVLGGSNLGDKGLIEQMQVFKADYYKTKSEVNRLKWFSGMITALLTTALGYVYKKLFG